MIEWFICVWKFILHMFVPRQDIEEFQEKILNFYIAHGRDLPWRKTRDPYAILVSEIMLQQTQVDRVIPKYEAWLEAFPDFFSLSKAPLSSVLKLWSGLGYNNRAKRLQDCAKIICAEYGGVFPREVSLLLTLPGIGPYTARSVLIFAFNEDVATVDTNIRRILIHEFNLDEGVSDKDLFRFAGDILPKGKSRDWHNGLMDYGASVVTSRKTGIKPKSRQSKFKHSRRWYRGRILKRLMELEDGCELDVLENEFSNDSYVVKDILDDLMKDGLVVCEKESVYKLKD